MLSIMLALILVGFGQAVGYNKNEWKKLIDNQNGKKGSWKAKMVEGIDYSDVESLKAMIGLKINPNAVYETELETPGRLLQAFPVVFDLRAKYPKCSSLTTIRNQWRCGACWAFAAATSLSDRICIKTYYQRAPYQRSYSYQDLIECCPYEYCGTGLGMGCQGGYVEGAFEYARVSGLVTGEAKGNTTTCKPFFMNAMDFNSVSPQCTNACTDPIKYPITYENDKKKILGYKIYSSFYLGSIEKVVLGVKDVITRRGTVVGTLDVYTDFYTYSSGVYSHQQGDYLGGHAVRVIGWGTDPSAGPYWLCVNSWGPYWGEKGFFKIKQGVDEVKIETMMVEGIL